MNSTTIFNKYENFKRTKLSWFSISTFQLDKDRTKISRQTKKQTMGGENINYQIKTINSIPNHYAKPLNSIVDENLKMI